VVVIEHSSARRLGARCGQLELVLARRYGDSALSLFAPVGAEEDPR